MTGFLLALTIVLTQSVGESPAPGETRNTESAATLNVHVLLPDGSPAGDVPLRCVPLIGSQIGEEILLTTDQQGGATVTLRGRGDAPDSGLLGHGVFRVVAMPESHAWALSDRYCWNERLDEKGQPAVSGGRWADGACTEWFEPGFSGDPTGDDSSDNTSVGRRIPISRGEELHWEVQLTPAESRAMLVVDQFGTPIADTKISIALDLHAQTRTGFGGQLVQTTLKTDAGGTLVVPRVGDYTYSFAAPGTGLYAPDAAFYNETVEQQIVEEGAKLVFQRPVKVSLEFQTVDAATGKPIEGALIGYRLQYGWTIQGGPFLVHKNAATLIPPSGITDDSGTFHFEGPLPIDQVADFYAEAPGYLPGQKLRSDWAPGQSIRIRLESAEKP